LSIARGSLKELETLLELATDLGFGPSEQITTAVALADRESRLLWKLRRSLQ
jgi:four helix bundle protein